MTNKPGLFQALSSRFFGRSSAGSSSRRLSVEDFWQQIFEKRARIESSHAESRLDEVDALIAPLLQSCSAGLTYECGRHADGTFELIISGDGIRDRIPDVLSLTRAAPKIAGWRIIAFRPRKGVGYELQLAESKISPKNVYYATEPDGEKTGIALTIVSEKPMRRPILDAAQFLLLDLAIGEYDVMTKLGHIACADRRPSDGTQGLKPLSALAVEIDAHFEDGKPH